MSGELKGIDVLAVMDAIEGWAREVSDQCIDSEDGLRQEYSQDLRNHREARAAVAELIEAAARAKRHLTRINGSSGWRDGEQSVLEQITAAVARCTGDS